MTSTSSEPFQRIALDIVGPLPITDNNNKYILTFQDDLTKFSGAYVIPNQEAATVAKTICKNFITTFGAPESVLTDLGTNFTSKIFSEVCKILKIKHIRTTAFHPQSNGAIERSHRTFKDFLRCFSNTDHNNWDEQIPFATFVYNTTPHCATGYSPYQLLFGRTANIPSSIKRKPEPTYNYDDYDKELKARLRLAHHIARENIIKTKTKTIVTNNKNAKLLILSPGDLVYLYNNKRKNKLDQLWKGPFEVTKINSENNTTILINGKEYRTHNNRLKPYTTQAT